MTDQQLIQALQRGDEAAYILLVQQHQQLVLNVCYGFLRNQEDAEDVAQEVFVDVYRKVSGFDGRSKLSTWLYKIAVNRSLDHIKATKRKKRFAPLLRIVGMGVDEVDTRTVAGRPNRPDEELERSEQEKTLMDAIDQLAENQATVFRLSKVQDLSNKEIADIMETSVSAVEALMHRAKKNLRVILADHYKNRH